MGEAIQQLDAAHVGSFDLNDPYDRSNFSGVLAAVESDRAASARRAAFIPRDKRLKFATFLNEAMSGQLPAYRVLEAMTTSDFPLLFGDTIQRQMLGRYTDAPVSWPAYAKRGTVPDFRAVKRFAMDGVDGALDKVAEAAEASQSALTETKYDYAVEVYERKVVFSLEAMVNDDLGAFRDIPDRLAVAARRTEEKLAAGLFASSSGPDATFYSAGNKNIVTSNPVLSIEGLETAYGVLGNMVDANGEPIVIDAAVLVVPPALKVTANNIIHGQQLWTQGSGGGTSNQHLVAPNWIQNDVTVAVNPYLPIINTTSGDKAWYLFAAPGVSRPALEIGFLQGMNGPFIAQKAPNSTIHAGALPFNVDFDTRAVEFKVIHVTGGVAMNPKASVASSGAGS